MTDQRTQNQTLHWETEESRGCVYKEGYESGSQLTEERHLQVTLGPGDTVRQVTGTNLKKIGM